MEPEEDLLDFLEKETGSDLKPRPVMTFQEKLQENQRTNTGKEDDILNKTQYGEDYNDLVTQMDQDGDLLGTQEGIQYNDSDDDNANNNDVNNHVEDDAKEENKMEIESSSGSNRSGQDLSQKDRHNDDNTENSNNMTSGEERMVHLLDAIDDMSQDIISTPASSNPNFRTQNNRPNVPNNSTIINIDRNNKNKIIEEDQDIDIGSTSKPDLASNIDSTANNKADLNIAPSQSSKLHQQRIIYKAKAKKAPNAIGPGSQDSQNDVFLTDNNASNNNSDNNNAASLNQKKFAKQNSSGSIQQNNSTQNPPVNNTTTNTNNNNNSNTNNTIGDTSGDIPPSTQSSRALPIWFSSKASIDKQTVSTTKDRQKLKSDLRNRLIEGWKNEGFSLTSASSGTSASANKSPSQAVLNRAPFCEITDDIGTVVKGRAVIFDLETSGFSNDDSIIEIGAVEVIDGYRTGVLFQSYAQPRKTVDYRAEAVHLITPQLLQSSPPIQFVMASFLHFIGNSPLIAHNAPFDMRFLINEIQRLELSDKFTKRTVFCTQSWFRRKFPNRSYALNDMAVQFNINLDTRLTQHSALVDAEILSQVLTAMFISEKVPKQKSTDLAATQTNRNKSDNNTTNNNTINTGQNNNETERNGGYI